MAKHFSYYNQDLQWNIGDTDSHYTLAAYFRDGRLPASARARSPATEAERRRRVDLRGWPELQRQARERAWERGYRPPPPEKTLVVDASGDPAYTRTQVGQAIEAVRRDGAFRRNP